MCRCVQNWRNYWPIVEPECKFKSKPKYESHTLTTNPLMYFNTRKTGDCCYQVAFQEINVLFNSAHFVNCNLFLTESLYGKNYFSKTIKVISNLTNIHRTIFSGQTYVQKWYLDYGHFYGQIWPFLTLMAIFTHQTVGRIVRIRPIVAHMGEEDSHKKDPFVPLNWPMWH